MSQTTIQIPDYEKIKIATQDKESDMYIESLLKLFNTSPKDLTFDQVQYMYYGYMYTEKFMSGAHLFPEFESPEVLDWDDMYECYRKAFDLFPFFIDSLENAAANASFFDESELSDIWKAQFERLLEVIDASGDGTNEAPYHVISVNNEYDFTSFTREGEVVHQSYENGIDILWLVNGPDESICFYVEEFIKQSYPSGLEKIS